MNIVQLTPGAGGMYCGGCIHDNALVTALRKLGHDTLMVPLYLPMTLDEPDQSAGTPVFFGGISVYLEQKFPLFRRAPHWFRRLLASRPILRWAGTRAAKTRAEEVGELTLSMIQGEEGRQAKELYDLTAWLKSNHRPEVVCLSNVLLAGLARRLKSELGVPVGCFLQGEDGFLDGLPAAQREVAWQALRARARDIDCFIAPSRYYADVITARLQLPAGRMHVVPNGISLDGYGQATAGDGKNGTASAGQPPVLGYFARMCPDKGLDVLVDAYMLLKQRPALERVRLHIGGGCGPIDEPFVNRLRQRLEAAGLGQDVAFFPNVDRNAKVRFLESLSVFSVPAPCGEAFGLYVIEALAAGVPVVQPRHGAFPELIEATGGGILCRPASKESLAEALESLLGDPARARELGRRGRQAVREKFTAECMARGVAQVFEGVCRR